MRNFLLPNLTAALLLTSATSFAQFPAATPGPGDPLTLSTILDPYPTPGSNPNMGEVDDLAAVDADDPTVVLGTGFIGEDTDGAILGGLDVGTPTGTSNEFFLVAFDRSTNMYVILNDPSGGPARITFADAQNESTDPPTMGMDGFVDGFRFAQGVTRGGTTTQSMPTFNDFAAAAAALPVEFAFLTAEAFKGTVELDWATISESANDFYEVQRSTDARTFEAIGQISGAGDSRELLNYEFSDLTAAAGTNYYRLRMVDFDGGETFSAVVTADLGGSSTATIAAFPNPAAEQLTVNLRGEWSAETLTVRLVDATGREVLNWEQPAGASRQVSLPQLPTGTYQLLVNDGQDVRQQRVLVSQ